MSQLLIFYWISAGLGFTYIVGSAALGHLHGAEETEGGDPGDVDSDGGSSGESDSGDPGDVDSDGGDPGDVDGGDPGDTNAVRVLQHQLRAGAVVPASKRNSMTWYFKALSLLSPTKLAIYLFFIGAFGVATLHLFPFLGHWSLIPATLFGYGAGRILLTLMSKFMDSLHSSTNFKQESLIGSTGELILSIEPGRTGQIVISTGGSRHSAPAKCKDPDLAIKGLTKVIVCDHKDGVFLVEPIPEGQE